jgi:hypothetical protein
VNRKVLHVTPHSGSGWQVKGEGAQRASALAPTKAAAIERARDLASSHARSQIKVHGQDGRIQTEWTYGKDPYPPKG